MINSHTDGSTDKDVEFKRRTRRPVVYQTTRNELTFQVIGLSVLWGKEIHIAYT